MPTEALRAGRVPVPHLSVETAMSVKRLRITLFGGAVIALAGLLLPLSSSAQSTERAPEPTPAVTPQTPAVVAQGPASATAPTRAARTIEVVAPDEVRPAPRRGIRWGVLEGADAAKLHNWRRETMYNFSSREFIRK